MDAVQLLMVNDSVIGWAKVETTNEDPPRELVSEIHILRRNLADGLNSAIKIGIIEGDENPNNQMQLEPFESGWYKVEGDDTMVYLKAMNGRWAAYNNQGDVRATTWAHIAVDLNGRVLVKRVR